MHRLPSDRLARVIGLILGLVTFALFAPVLTHEFINYDDGVYVYENPRVQGGLTTEGIRWAFSTGYQSNWHPLTWLSHMLDCQLYGLKPWGHHLTSLLLHVANTVLLFVVLRRMTGAVWRSALVAALFGWHPLHVESVVWAAERKDVLSTLFWLLALLAYAGYVEETKDKNPGRKAFYYWLALFCFALGLMSKPMLVTLPFMLLLLDYWPLNRAGDGRLAASDMKTGEKQASWARLIWEKMPFFLLAAVSTVVTYVAQRRGGAMSTVEIVPFAPRACNALLSYAGYLRKLFWPSDLAVFYPLPASWSDYSVSHLIGAGLMLVAITAAVIIWRRRRPWLLIGWLWFLGTLVPVLGLVQVGAQSMADRYTYMPLVGVFIMLVWGGAELLDRTGLWRQAAAWAITTPVLAACVALTWLQVGYWRNSETLFRHAVQVTHGNVLAYANLGAALITSGKAEAGRSNLLVCLKISPGYLPALNGLGVLCLREGDAAGAGRYFGLITGKNPSDGTAHFNLGVALAAQGKYPEAVEEYSTAERLKPDAADVRYNRGIALAKMGDVAGAADEFRSALWLKPDYAEVHYWLGEMLSREGRFKEAVESYHEALRLRPDWPVALGTLAWVLATNPQLEIRNGPEAVRLAERACNLMKTPDLRYLSALDAAYAEAGRFDDAIRTANRILQQAVGPTQKTFADETHIRLELYRTRKPYHESAQAN